MRRSTADKTRQDRGSKLADSLKDYGCDTRYVSLVENGGFSGLLCTHRKNRNTDEHELGLRGFVQRGLGTNHDWELRDNGKLNCNLPDDMFGFLDRI